MSYTLHVEPRSSYLYITVTGENSYDTVDRYLSEVRNLCLQHNCQNVLIVENLAGSGLDTFSIFDLVTRHTLQTSPLIRKIAYVDINPDHNQEAMQFAENVAVNRGVSVQVFSTISAAEDWMSDQENSGSNSAGEVGKQPSVDGQP